MALKCFFPDAFILMNVKVKYLPPYACSWDTKKQAVWRRANNYFEGSLHQIHISIAFVKELVGIVALRLIFIQ